jgi:hypothetical protein
MPDQRVSALWVPGVARLQVYDDDEARFFIGASVGWSRPPDVGGWVVDHTFVRRAELTPAGAEALSVSLPESRIDPGRFPHLHRAAASAPLLAVGFNGDNDSRPSGPRAFPYVHVNHDPTGVWLRDFGIVGTVDGEVVRFGGMSFSLSSSLASGETGAPGSTLHVDKLAPMIVQRALVELTRGAVDLDAIGLALDLRDTTEERDMEDWEAWLAEIWAHAEGMEADAREIVRRFASASEAEAVDVPVYGKARRSRFPRTTLWAGEGGPFESCLELPETSRWIVDGAEPWKPSRPWRAPAGRRPAVASPFLFGPPPAGDAAGESDSAGRGALVVAALGVLAVVASVAVAKCSG